MLEVEFAGIKLKNPVIAASATPTINLDGLRRAAEGGAGAIVTKSAVFPKKVVEGMEYVKGRPTGLKPSPRFMLLNKGETYDPALTNEGSYFTLFRVGEPYLKPEELVEMIEKIKKSVNIPVIASIAGAVDDLEEWQKLAKPMQEAGADAVELNLHAIPIVKYTNPDIVRAVKEVVSIPVIAKLMYGWEDPAELGSKVERAGADAITAVGTFGFPTMEIDVEAPRILTQPSYYGAGGPWYRPVSLAFVSRLAKTVKIPVLGVTGVVTWKDAVKYIMVGATAVQVCAAIYAKGYRVLGEIAMGIEEFMRRKGYQKIDDFRGSILKEIVPPWKLEWGPPIKATVDEASCDGCGDCVESCFYGAISLEENLASIDSDKCDGCGLCVWVCASKAVAMEKQRV